MNRFRWFNLLGLSASVLIWALPASLKPFHIRRDFDDYKILFIERDDEYGFAADGLLDVHVSQAFGGSRAALARIRQDWVEHGSRSKLHWPTTSRRLHYDEWGPSHHVRDDAVEMTQVGRVFCVPYSIFALMFAVPLAWSFIPPRFTWLHLRA